ncbi:AAA family ATPase [uncultured Tateyamaria sp.]|uniref:AAA family ATPase n=1 Tax=uncultured Tateyamaria sp. TaxID=455651 RepID=UPI002618103A|nr:AAA family ATPase [uncultured Tateyamaria sp.]
MAMANTVPKSIGRLTLDRLPSGPVWDAACSEKNWLIWKEELRPDGKLAKIPWKSGCPADRNVAADMNFDNILKALEVAQMMSDGDIFGVGYFPRVGAAMRGYDFDNCVEDGKIANCVKELFTNPETYVEISPSGTGLRAWAAPIGDGLDDAGSEKNGFGHSGTNGKFFTFTGNQIQGSPSQINAAPLMRARIFSVAGSSKKHSSAAQWDGPLEEVDDAQVRRRISNLKNSDDDFARRWDGDKTGLEDQSRSGLDFAVIGHLARDGFNFSEVVHALCHAYEQPSAAVSDWQNGKERQMRRTFSRSLPPPRPSAEEEFGFVSNQPANAHLAPAGIAERKRSAVCSLFDNPWRERDLTSIPKPSFLYNSFFARGYVSVTAAPPKVGKSFLSIAEAVDMATGQGFLTEEPQEPLKVVYFNKEDDQDTLNSRVSAVLTHYDIAQSAIAGRLYIVSGVTSDFHLISGDSTVQINEDAFAGLGDFVTAQKPDVIVLDPLQDLSQSPETNEVFRMLGGRFRRFASTHNVAIGLVHHTRKPQRGFDLNIDDMRGGSALRGVARFSRILAPMTEKEAAHLGVRDHRYFFRVADAESNLAPPTSEHNAWFKRQSVRTPAGYSVAAVQRWAAPDMNVDDTPENAAKVRAAIEAAPNLLRKDHRAEAWVGKLIADRLGWDAEDAHDKSRAKHLQKVWTAAGYLAEFIARENGKDVPFINVGPVDPMGSIL